MERDEIENQAGLAPRFMALFAGLDRAHGVFEVTSSRDDGKQTGRADTKHEPVTLDKWERHLAGRRGIGIVPVRDDGTCVFGAIDVDVYTGLDAGALARRAGDLLMPVVPCRSKSGGVHLWLFAGEPVPAAAMIERLREVAAVLGHAGREIFPKQSKLDAGMKQVGNWINMPYFGETRRAPRIDGGELTDEEFLEFAEGARQPRGFFERPLGATSANDFADGPPCLQHLARAGFPEGTRNNGLFQIAVYARKALGDAGNWQGQVHSLNSALMRPELPYSEVQGLIKSAAGKRYGYACDQSPMREHCDKALCRSRKNGVGAFGAQLPELGQLTKFDTDPPLWEWEIEGQQVRLTTDELHDFNKFSKRLLEQCHRVVPRMKDDVWKAGCLGPALERLRIERMPDDASDEGQVWEMLEKFCTGRVQARSKAEILSGKPWSSEGFTWFRLTDLLRHLTIHRFQGTMTPQAIAFHLKRRGAEHKVERLDKNGKSANLWGVKSFPEMPAVAALNSLMPGVSEAVMVESVVGKYLEFREERLSNLANAPLQHNGTQQAHER